MSASAGCQIVNHLLTPEHPFLRTFIFFAAFSFLSIVFNYFVVVETANVTLENMDKQFHDSSNHEVRFPFPLPSPRH